ncbi:MAG TPA: 5-oxoprolinase subunit PxpA [Vicinamibacterales bacterium]|nr:5-oxoprolinase subunit PxpA [Vicinamibacterales bacterium]
MNPQRIDLNSDVGESFGAWRMGADEQVMRSITSANVACGFHAGDPGVMRHTVRLAREAGASVGAHPGFPDLAGFGRRDLRASPREVEDMVLYQIGALAAIAASEGVRLAHVKAHGALYNMAARDRALADAIARAVRDFDPGLVLFGLPGSALLEAGSALGLRVAAEGFADRAYEADGSLTPRTRPGAVIHDPEKVVRRALLLVREGRVTATDGTELKFHVDTLCTHGDTPDAHELTRLLREGLERQGVLVQPLTRSSYAD